MYKHFEQRGDLWIAIEQDDDGKIVLELAAATTPLFKREMTNADLAMLSRAINQAQWSALPMGEPD